jgi:CRP/FNR family cyclic AMP-dependent transcriptional regulator
MPSSQEPSFNVHALLKSAGVAGNLTTYRRAEAIFTQGEPCDHVLYLQHGFIKLSVVSRTGRDAIVGLLGPGEFFGEASLAGRSVHNGSATAMTDSRVLAIEKNQMRHVLQTQAAMSDRFIAHLLARNVRAGDALLDQLLNSSEKRLARTLLQLSRDAHNEQAGGGGVPRITQETLAEIVGTTRSRVNFFMKKFERLGLIAYSSSEGVKVNNQLLDAILSD